MSRKPLIALVCLFVVLRQTHGQEIVLARETKSQYPRAERVSHPRPSTEMHIEKGIAVQPMKPAPENAEIKPAVVQVKKESAVSPGAKQEARSGQGVVSSASPPPHKAEVVAAKTQTSTIAKKDTTPSSPVKTETHAEQKTKTPSVAISGPKPPATAAASPVPKSQTPVVAKKETAPSTSPTKTDVHPEQNQNSKTATASKSNTKAPGVTAPSLSTKSPTQALAKKEEAPATIPPKNEAHGDQAVKSSATSTIVLAPKTGAPTTGSSTASARSQETTTSPQMVSNHFETAFIKLADGFDFPVGKPDAQGYYKARGFRSRGHLGEDWDGVRGGDTDLGDPIYSIGSGLVVFARDCHMGWGNVIIVRHSYREGGVVKNIDALYGHLNSMLVSRGDSVARGQKIATMGNAHGLYDAHLHLEIRKNLEIGMSRAAFAQDFSNYYDPSQFILTHRHLQAGGGSYRVAMNTFVRDAHINFSTRRNYTHSHYRGGTGESAAALKKAVASQH